MRISGGFFLAAALFSGILFQILLPGNTEAQTPYRLYARQDSLTVTVNNISIDGEFSLRGLSAAFPYPVLTAISVFDHNGKPVIGLADTSRWLSPEDRAEIGLPVFAIWQQLLEFHRDNPIFPADPNIFNQTPPPLLTEVRETVFLPTNTMLVMDASTSMREEIDDAKAGARLFVDLMRPDDRTGVVIFSKIVNDFQPLTSEKNQLIAVINDAKIIGGTALYDAILFAIQGVKNENGRRGVIAYTDGQDNSSSITPLALIDSARAYNLPIFTIALGSETRITELRQIANQTGGLFFKAATAKELSAIYSLLSELIQNYYLMAHASPDPVRNNTWRVVEVSVNTPQAQGKGAGQYFVPGLPTPPATDLALNLSSRADSTIIIGSDTLNAVQPGESFEYQIDLKNFGPARADSATLFHFLPDSVRLLNASIAPFSSEDNLLVWQLGNLEAGADTVITLTVALASDIPTGIVELVSQAHIAAVNDTLLDNNFDTDTVRVHLIEPSRNFDLALSQRVFPDTVIVVGGDSVQAVFTGKAYRYELVIENNGPRVAYDFTLENLIPDSVSIAGFSLPPQSQRDDTLFWQFDSLPAGESLTIAFNATASTLLPFTPFPLNNFAQISAEHDTLADNNFTSTIVYAIRRPTGVPQATDVALSLISVTDTVKVVNGDTIKAVRPGDIYRYFILLENLGKESARTVRLRQILPDSVHFVSASIEPIETEQDTLEWQFRRIERERKVSLTITVQLSPFTTIETDELVSFASFTAENDTFATNNAAVDTVGVVFAVTPANPNYDLALTKEATTDTTILIAGQVEPAVRRGEIYSYRLQVHNLGPAVARNFSVWDAVPDSVGFSDFSLEPQSRIRNTYFWEIDSLTVDGTLTIDFNAKVSDALKISPFPLPNHSQVIAENDTRPENDFASTLVYAVVPGRMQPNTNVDLSVRQAAITDSFAVIGNDTVRFARADETYEYIVTVANDSSEASQDVVVSDVLPDSVSVVSFEFQPEIARQDSLVWRLGYLLPQDSVQLRFNVTVAPNMPVGQNLLINLVQASAVNEAASLLTNNTSVDTVFNLFGVQNLQPLIEASPPVVEIGNPVAVRVQVLDAIRSWDLWVYMADGTTDSTYADAYVASTQLVPNQWFDIDPTFKNTRLLTEAEQEEIIFEIRIRGLLGELKTARATVTVRSSNDFALDRNVFNFNEAEPLGIKFKLSSNRIAQLDVYDVAGSHISQLVEAPYQAGWNTFLWKGATENGKQIGSGVYLITLRSGGFNAMKKVIIVR